MARAIVQDGSSIRVGLQTAHGSPVTSDAGMYAGAYPLAACDYGLDWDSTDSDIIQATGAASPVEKGKYYATGSFRTGALINKFIPLIRPIFGSKFSGTVITGRTARTTIASGDHPLGTATAANNAALTNETALKAKPARVLDLRSTTAKTLMGMKLKLTLSVASTGVLRITGRRTDGVLTDVDSGDRPWQQEDVTFTAATTGTTANGWAWIEKIERVGTGIADSTTVKAEWDSPPYGTELKIGSTLGDPTTLYMVKGTIPEIAYDVYYSNASFSASSTGISVEVGLEGGRTNPYRTIAGGFDTPKFAVESTDATNYPPVSAERFPAWAAGLILDNTFYEWITFDCSIEKNLERSPGNNASRYAGQPVSNRNREVTFEAEVLVDTGTSAADFTNWAAEARKDARLPIQASYRQYISGVESRLDITSPSSQITTSPKFAYDGPGAMTQRLGWLGLPSTSDTSEVNLFAFHEDAFTP